MSSIGRVGHGWSFQGHVPVTARVRARLRGPEIFDRNAVASIEADGQKLVTAVPRERKPRMVIVLIRTALRPDADLAAYEALNERMLEIVRSIPGFVGVNGYASPDGDEVGMVRFESLDALRAWREHPEHVVVQARGRAEFYASLRIEICEVVRAYDFSTSPS